jgi:4-diphosphocytidyl-2-C-methyl-D-erythritol kinase
MQVEAYAKLTLSLHITGVRADGYHELDALMVSVSEPHDTVSIEPAPHTSLEVTGPYAAGVPADPSNLVWRAAETCGASVAIRLHKGIPAGAGLGGGSADAAAVLVALEADPRLASALGADVPFCMRGGAARVRGIGDVLEPVELRQRVVLIATPRFGCVTVDVYRAWDELGGPHDETNDLEPAAHHVEPRLVAFKHAVERAAGAPAILAGSGSSYAVVFDKAEQAERARVRVSEVIDGSVWLGTAPA